MCGELARRTWPSPDRLLRLSALSLLAVLLAAGLARAVWDADALAWLAWAPGCPFRSWTGHACPGCGMTRAWLLLGQLRFSEALAANPAAPLLVVAAGATAVRPRLPHLPDLATAGLLAAVIGGWLLRSTTA